MLWHIVRWEVMRYLRNKQFLIGLLITPLIFAVFGALPTIIARFDQPRPATYLVIDELGATPLLTEMLADTAVTVQPRSDDEQALAAAVLDGEADGYFVLDEQFVATGTLAIHVEKQRPRPEALTSALGTILQSMRMQEQQIDADVLSYVSARPVIFSSIIAADEEESPVGGIAMGVVFGFLLFYLIVSSGAMLLQSAVQEKRDRMSEVILSSVGADTLMGGKIIGHFFLGALQIGLWIAIGVPVALYAFKLPIGDYIVPSLIPVLAMFTLLGYLFYAALFVGIGATMEDIQSASNTQGLVFMLPMLSFLVAGPVVTNPEGLIARIATFFPVTTPTVAVLRVGLDAMPPWEIAAVAAIMVVSTWLVIKGASRLFRTGMLMYGKNATWKEMWKWIRHPG